MNSRSNGRLLSIYLPLTDGTYLLSKEFIALRKLFVDKYRISKDEANIYESSAR